jgi:hypothetical protein
MRLLILSVWMIGYNLPEFKSPNFLDAPKRTKIRVNVFQRDPGNTVADRARRVPGRVQADKGRGERFLDESPFSFALVGLELNRAVEQRLARQAHNLEVVGSIPTGATRTHDCLTNQAAPS